MSDANYMIIIKYEAGLGILCSLGIACTHERKYLYKCRGGGNE